MSNIIHVKPADGARIRQPERNSAVMGPDGDFVSRTVFYEQHIAAGSLIVTDKKPPQPSPAAPEPAAAAAPAEKANARRQG